jgi:hypothetical protein
MPRCLSLSFGAWIVPLATTSPRLARMPRLVDEGKHKDRCHSVSLLRRSTRSRSLHAGLSMQSIPLFGDRETYVLLSLNLACRLQLEKICFFVFAKNNVYPSIIINRIRLLCYILKGVAENSVVEIWIRDKIIKKVTLGVKSQRQFYLSHYI